MEHFNSELETLPLSKLRKLQNERLQHQVKRVYERVAFYKGLFNENGIDPKEIKGVEDLHKLPFTKKVALRDNYPFALFASPMEDVVRLHCSSGTTGKPIVVGYTKNDIDVFQSRCPLSCSGRMQAWNEIAECVWLWTLHRRPWSSLWGRETGDDGNSHFGWMH
jgi:phenylacetate-coenzyme A ligase PaaK-like adenylate-forming protein